jgi:hypothetical protein
MSETVSKPNLVPEWIWPAFTLALGLTGALTALLAPTSKPVPAPPRPERPPIIHPARPAPGPFVAHPAMGPSASPVAIVPAPAPPTAAPVAPAAPAPALAPVPPAPAVASGAGALPSPPRLAPGRSKRRGTDRHSVAQHVNALPLAGPSSRAASAAAPLTPQTHVGPQGHETATQSPHPPFRLLAVSGNTVWVTIGDKSAVSAQMGDDLPSGLGRVVAVTRSGASFEKDGKKFDMTVE